MANKALVSIARILVSLVAGGIMFYFWSTWRPNDEKTVSIGAAVVVVVLCFVLLHKLGGEAA